MRPSPSLLLSFTMEQWLQSSVPLHVLLQHASAKAEGNQEEVESTLRWLPEGSRVALLEALAASLEESAPSSSFSAGAAGDADPASFTDTGAADPSSFMDTGADDPSSFAADDGTVPTVPAADPFPAEVPDLSEGGNPKYAHLLSFQGHMGHTYDEWYAWWVRQGWLESMVDGAAPLTKEAAAGNDPAEPPLPPPADAPADAPADPDLSFSAGVPPDPADVPGPAKKKSYFAKVPFEKTTFEKGVTVDPPPEPASEGSGLPALDPSRFRLAPEVMYRYGPFTVALCHRLECRESCIDCASGHCGATLDPSKPETLSHRHRCRV